jgi:hypothetical protein
MSQRKISQSPLTRRSWLTLAGAALTGCGGGGGGNLLASLPGTGGTGAPLFTQGSISGFGSVIINGIKFDDLQATVQIDGAQASSADLRLGMVAGVQGVRGADLALGQASNIEVWSIAQGVVTRVGASEFDVAGMTIQTDSNTSFEGVGSTAALLKGKSWVIVWGLQANQDGIHWTATRVAVIATNTVTVSTGVVAVSKNEHTLNAWKLSGATVSVLTDGQLVRVEGVVSSEENLAVTSVKVLSAGFDTQSQDELEIEGVVTSVASTYSFMMGNISVNASRAVVDPTNGQVIVGARLEVHGVWSSSVLNASQIHIESQKISSIEISARIDQYTSLDNFVMRGQRCNATGASFTSGSASNLKTGVKIKVVGNKAGDVLLVTSVSFSN